MGSQDFRSADNEVTALNPLARVRRPIGRQASHYLAFANKESAQHTAVEGPSCRRNGGLLASSSSCILLFLTVGYKMFFPSLGHNYIFPYITGRWEGGGGDVQVFQHVSYSCPPPPAETSSCAMFFQANNAWQLTRFEKNCVFYWTWRCQIRCPIRYSSFYLSEKSLNFCCSVAEPPPPFWRLMLRVASFSGAPATATKKKSC